MNMTEKQQNWIVGLLIVTFLIVAFNSIQLGQIRTVPATQSSSLIGAVVAGSNSEVIPTGIPAIYGEELGISYDDISPNDPSKTDATINTMAQIDRSVTLTGADRDRYINILFKMEGGISCEYCCGAQSVIFKNGEPACGCAHSSAMRGLTKYLITEHGDEYTNEEILEEIGKWKTLFFPTQMQAKAGILESNGVEFNYINLASNKFRGIEKGIAGSGMVGGC